MIQRVCSGTDGTIVLATTDLADGSYTVSSTAGNLTMVVVANEGTISGLGQGTYDDITVTQTGCTSIADIDVSLTDPATATINDRLVLMIQQLCFRHRRYVLCYPV